MTENHKLLSFSGVIGRKWFLLRSMVALLIPILALVPIFIFGYFSGSGGPTETLSGDGLNKIVNLFGLIIIIPWTILNLVAVVFFFLVVISLQVRRGRDVFRQTRARPLVEIILVILFWVTKGFLGLGGFALFIWPGALTRQAKSSPADSALR